MCHLHCVAFGLGVDIPDIYFVVHWGSSDTVLQFWQEVGRADRDMDAWAHTYITPVGLMRRKKDIQEF